jgi:hypothetical protein
MLQPQQNFFLMNACAQGSAHVCLPTNAWKNWHGNNNTSGNKGHSKGCMLIGINVKHTQEQPAKMCWHNTGQ